MEKHTDKVENIQRDFIYVDCWSTYTTGRWKRIKISDVEDFRKQYRNKSVYISIQRYRSPAAPESNIQEISISDFVIDIDNTDLEQAHHDASVVFEYFRELDAQPRIWFSGKKGFHISVPWQALGLMPNTELNQYFASAVSHIETICGLPSIDMKLYSGKRLLRLPNSIHPDTKLYKHEFNPDRFMSMSLEEILVAAVGPSKYNHKYEPVLSSAAKKWWDSLMQVYETSVEIRESKPVAPIKKLSGTPVCMSHLLDKGCPEGFRNRAIINMTCFWKDQGLSMDEAIQRNLEWTKRIYGNDESKLRERIGNATAVPKTIYSSPERYRFTCSSMYAISKGDFKVPCDTKEKCLFIDKPEDQLPEKLPIVPLWKASDSSYVYSDIKVPIMLAAVESKPYMVPRQAKVSCPIAKDLRDAEGVCSKCKLFEKNETDIFTDMHTPQVIRMFRTPREKQNRTIMYMAGVPGKCKEAEVFVDNDWYGNIQAVYLSPYVSEQTDSNDDYKEDTNEYVTREAFFLGHEVTVNHNYVAKLVSYPHPEDQSVIHVIGDLEPVESSLDNFVIPPRMYERMKIFQVAKGESIADKMNAIHDDLEANVYRITGRRNAGIAIDLFFHSVLGFRLFGHMLDKGWLEVLIVGDTAQGKSTMAKLMKWHYGVGEWISGEMAKRTGLVHTTLKDVKGNGYYIKWGKIPQNDRGAVIIDEFTGIPKEEWGTFTELRSTGNAQCSGAASGKTKARTRMLLLTNPVNGKVLNDYRFGVQSLIDIFDSPADVRRVDLCCMVKKGEVDIDKLNSIKRAAGIEHQFTSDLCTNLIMWAWSRKPAQIVFDNDAEEAVIEVAKNLISIYDSAKMELVESSDQKHKVARVAAAVAARVFSTDKEYKKLIVKREHVLYAGEVFKECYDSAAMRYREFSRDNKDTYYASKELIEKFRSLIVNLSNGDPAGVLRAMSDSKKIDPSIFDRLFDEQNFSRGGHRRFFNFLSEHGLAVWEGRMIVKTPLLTRVLDDIMSEMEAKK